MLLFLCRDDDDDDDEFMRAARCVVNIRRQLDTHPRHRLAGTQIAPHRAVFVRKFSDAAGNTTI